MNVSCLQVAAIQSTVILGSGGMKYSLLELKSGVYHPREKHDRRTKLYLMLQSVSPQL